MLTQTKVALVSHRLTGALLCLQSAQMGDVFPVTNELDCGDGVTGVHLCRSIANHMSEVHTMYCRSITPPQSPWHFIYCYYDDCVCT